ncbi:MAG TPA: VCBS repeat-containing protein [Byssovorax sp.]|jgi:hypothetical protein
MSARAALALAPLLALAACSRAPSGSKRETQPAPVAAIPRADKLFCVDVDGSGRELLAGADGADLWLADLGRDGARVRFRDSGPGVPQLVTAGDFGRGRRLYVARGAPDEEKPGLTPAVVVQEIDPKTGASVELVRVETSRAEAVDLAVVDVDRDKKPDLAFAYYASNTTVESRDVRADGTTKAGAPERTAQARAHADVDGDGIDDAIVGRLYGEGPGAAQGDLRVDMGSGWVTVPTGGGVRAVAAQREADGKSTIYFADGWTADYGRHARAQIKRATWNGAAFDVELVGTSPTDSTFAAITPLHAPSGAESVVGVGNVGVTLFESATGARPFVSTALGPPAKGVAACRVDRRDSAVAGGDGAASFTLWAPGDPPHEVAKPRPAP